MNDSMSLDEEYLCTSTGTSTAGPCILCNACQNPKLTPEYQYKQVLHMW